MGLVYVLNKRGKPLMPTSRCGHVRKLLKAGQAAVVKNRPFTIRLKYETEDICQPLILGIDTGRENIGLAVCKKSGECVYAANVETHNGSIRIKMQKRAAQRRQRRINRRKRKQRRAIRTGMDYKTGSAERFQNKACKARETRYPGSDQVFRSKVCKPKESRFANRTKPAGWLPPSGRQLIQIHLRSLDQVLEVLPVTDVVVEAVRTFLDVSGKEKLKRNQRQNAVSRKQNGQCYLCGGPIEEIHHIKYQCSGGSDQQQNLVGVCADCHRRIHQDRTAEKELLAEKDKPGSGHKISLLISVMPQLLEALEKKRFENKLTMAVTDGGTTSRTRKKLGLEKDHCLDAIAIALSKELSINSVILPEVYYTIRRYKKKSKKIISSLNQRVYKYAGRIIAVNRHKGDCQKADALDDYMAAYASAHSEAEARRHFHELEVVPAKRSYTYRKHGEAAPCHPGDVILWKKTDRKTGKQLTEVFVAAKVKMNKCEIEFGERCQSRRFKFCRPIKSGCLQISRVNQF